MSDLSAGSPERFGYSWQQFDMPTPDQRRQFDRWTAILGQDFWRGKRFLDAGCGGGRNSLWAMQYGAMGGLAIDIDEGSLAIAERNLAGTPVEVRKTSLYDLPATADFDVAFSIGVVHHLADPELGVQRMVGALAPGGTCMVWLYGRENMGWLVNFVDPLRKALFSRMPLKVLHLLSNIPTAILWAWLRLGGGRIEYYRMLRNFSFAHLRHIVFDHLLPKTAIYYRRSEATALLEQAGLVDVQADWTNQMSWTVRGTKPAAAPGQGQPPA
jgi:SAM-dependent methyltransferase